MSKLYEIIEKPISGEWGSEDKLGGGVPVLRTTNFTNIGVIDYSNVVTRVINTDKIKNKYLQKGDIIIEKSGGSPAQPVGRVVVFEGEDGKYLFNNFTSVLRINDQKIYFYKYVFYHLFSDYKEGKTRKFQNKTTGILNLKLERFVKETEIKYRPLETQKQIAKTLDTVSELLAILKQQLAELDNLIKTTFYDMFGDPVTNEKGWEIKTIAEIAEQKLSYGSGASAIEYDGITRYIRITDINDNGSLNDDIVSPSETSAKYNLNDGDILFARSGATVGKTLRYRRSFGRCIYAGYLIRLVPKKALVLPDYIYYFTKTDYYKGFIESNMKTVAQPNINAQQYGTFKICVPPLNLQTQFAEIVTKTEEQKALVQKAINETQYLFDSLMSGYFD